MSPLRYARMVLWSFFGIRKGSGAERELGDAKFVPLVITAIAIVALLIAGLLTLASLAS